MQLKVLIISLSGNMPKYKRAQGEINSPQETHHISMRNLRHSYEKSWRAQPRSPAAFSSRSNTTWMRNAESVIKTGTKGLGTGNGTVTTNQFLTRPQGIVQINTLKIDRTKTSFFFFSYIYWPHTAINQLYKSNPLRHISSLKIMWKIKDIYIFSMAGDHLNVPQRAISSILNQTKGFVYFFSFSPNGGIRLL